jgi:hypothetical protein
MEEYGLVLESGIPEERSGWSHSGEWHPYYFIKIKERRKNMKKRKYLVLDSFSETIPGKRQRALVPELVSVCLTKEEALEAAKKHIKERYDDFSYIKKIDKKKFEEANCGIALDDMLQISDDSDILNDKNYKYDNYYKRSGVSVAYFPSKIEKDLEVLENGMVSILRVLLPETGTFYIAFHAGEFDYHNAIFSASYLGFSENIDDCINLIKEKISHIDIPKKDILVKNIDLHDTEFKENRLRIFQYRTTEDQYDNPRYSETYDIIKIIG